MRSPRGPIPIVPDDDGPGRALVAVIAILACLAGLAAGIGAVTVRTAQDWGAAVSREATVQLLPTPGRDLDADLAQAAAIATGTPGIASARILSRLDGERLLEPWLGRGLDMSDLPVPRLVALVLARDPRPDLTSLGRRLADTIPGSRLDDHSEVLTRLSRIANAVASLAVAIVILVTGASCAAIGFATRGVMAGRRDVVEVLHVVGATNGFITRVFARRFAMAGLKGGLLGALGASALLALVVWLAGYGPAGSGLGIVEGLFGAASIGWPPYLAIAAVAIADGALTGLVSIVDVKRRLAAIDR